MLEHKTVSLAEQVFERLERDILGGVYPRGALLTELGLGNDLNVRNGRYRGKSLPAKSESQNTVEILSAGDLTRCVALECKRKIGVRHSASVIADTNERHSSARYLYRDIISARIY